MTYYNCVLISEDEIKQKYPNLLKDGYTSTDIKTEITSWQEKQRRLEGNSYKYDTIPSENEIYNRIEEKEQEYYNSPAYEKELQDILVQTCIDFINENELKDVDVVYFSADSLQESARCNEWTPSTDSFLTLEGMEYDEKCDFHVRRLVDKSF